MFVAIQSSTHTFLTDYGTILVAVIVAVIAAVPGLLSFVAQMKKNKYDAAEVVQDAAVALIEPFRARNTELTELLRECRFGCREKEQELAVSVRMNTALAVQRDSALECVRRLAHQVRSLGGVPIADANSYNVIIDMEASKDGAE